MSDLHFRTVQKFNILIESGTQNCLMNHQMSDPCDPCIVLWFQTCFCLTNFSSAISCNTSQPPQLSPDFAKIFVKAHLGLFPVWEFVFQVLKQKQIPLIERKFFTSISLSPKPSRLAKGSERIDQWTLKLRG